MPTSRTARPTWRRERQVDPQAPPARPALPQWLETDRLPCLATGTPAAATTKAAVVETLKVPEPSPPVPQVSTAPPVLSPGLHLGGLLAHHLGRAGDLVDGLALHAQRR